METFQFDYVGYLRNMVFLIVLMGVMSYILVKLKTRKGDLLNTNKLSFLKLTGSQNTKNNYIEVVEHKVLEARKHLYLIRLFDEQYWLIGTTDTQIEALGQVQPPSWQSATSHESKSFSNCLEEHEVHKTD